jgi:PKD repeat protein
MTRWKTHLIFLAALAALVLIGGSIPYASAAEPYDAIFTNASLTPKEKLIAFTEAAGWTPELDEWLAYHQIASLESPQETTEPTITNVAANPTVGGVTTQITLSATVQGATSMQWQSSTDGGASWQNIFGGTTASITWTPGVIGTYQVRLQATNSDGTTTSITVTVTIYPAPTVTATVSPPAGSMQQVLTLTGTVTDPAPGTTTYQWQSAPAETGAWIDVEGATTLTYQYAYDGTAGTAWYRLAATGVGGMAYSAAVSYTAYAVPTVTATVSPPAGPVTQEFTLMATATDTTSYQWQVAAADQQNWQNILGATGPTATHTFPDGTMTGTYYFRVIASGPGGTATSIPVSVLLSDLTPVISSASVVPNMGAVPLTVSLTAAATNNPTYTWQLLSGSTWTTIATGATATYTFAAGTPGGVYSIRVVAENQYGSDTRTVTIEILEPPIVEISRPESGSYFGQGRSITFEASGAADSYTWEFGDGSTVAGKHVSHSYSTLGTYTVELIASNIAGVSTDEIVLYIIERSDLTLIISSISSRGATLTAEIDGETVPDGTKIWFEVYSPTGQTVWTSTKKNYTTPHISTTVSGMPLLSGQSYTVRAFADGYAPSMLQSMTLIAAIAPPYDPMGKTLEESGLLQDPFNVSRLLNTLPGVLGEPMGGGKLGVSIAFGVIIMFVLTALWLRQNDIVMPTLLGLIMGFFLIDRAPPEFGFIGYPLMIVCGVGLVYALFKKR